MREWGCAWGHRFPLACAVLRPLVMILFPLLPLRRQRTMMAGQKTAEEAQEQAAREFIERFNASGEKALDRLQGARADHILHSNLHQEEHDWKQLFDGQEPTWEQVKSILKGAIREGQESAHEDRLSQFERSIECNGYRVFVRFVKGADGLVEHISTGYFKGE